MFDNDTANDASSNVQRMNSKYTAITSVFHFRVMVASNCVLCVFMNLRRKYTQDKWLSVMADVSAGRWSTGAIHSQLKHLLWPQRLDCGAN